MQSSRRNSQLVSLTLKTAGIVIILAALLDMIILSIPFQPLDAQWRVTFVTQLVDRGVVPLVGLALLLTGYWFDTNRSVAPKPRKNWTDPRFGVLILASVLGFLYLVLFPFHLNNVRLLHAQAVEQVNQQSTQAENQLEGRLNQEVAQQRAQIGQLLENPALIDQAAQANQITQEQATLLRQFEQNPQALDQFLGQRVEELRTQLQTQIAVRREEALQSARTEALKSGLRIGVSSLLLAIGFIVIGWSGLKNSGQKPPSRAPR